MYKIPESVLVVIHTAALQVLVLRRADSAEDFWQSVTGSKQSAAETWRETALREVREETGLDAGAPGCRLADWGLENVYSLYPQWRHRYAPGVMTNTEHVLGLWLPAPAPVRLNPREHTACAWLPWREAADRCYSPSNAEAILWLPHFLHPA
ncbi:dihydroneopterin triphosphate diphosphatase [Comamonas flocculans]|uniref:Dihydroneopterin triphosphate diphosphatase n=1 Tax=Comamonas flocculans TaxID=2597701 RepID=A0A5B8S010_9BURK|nr:dihydroneopterin triphosphate diphosphatase [Comamonas flocculans]QEA13905.1 dihydroneopterin triphosphate diphosphatase [Comamonas flocculans]